MTQDENFLPYTTNATLAAGLPAAGLMPQSTVDPMLAKMPEENFELE